MDYTSAWTKVLRVLILLLVLAGASAALYIIFGKMESAERAKLLLESSKSLLYLITVLILGAFIAQVVKSFEKDRRADRALHEFRSEFLKRLHSTYQRIAASRHSLSACGLTDRFSALTAGMTTIQADIYFREFESLFDGHGELERLILEVEQFPDSFSSHVQLTNALRDMRIYLNSLLEEYRQFWPKIQPAPGAFAVNTLVKLRDFTGGQPQSDYEKSFAPAYGKALAFVREDLLPLKRVVEAA